MASETEQRSKPSFKSESTKIKNASLMMKGMPKAEVEKAQAAAEKSKSLFKSQSTKIKNASLIMKGRTKEEQQAEEETRKSKSSFKTAAMVTKALAGKPRSVSREVSFHHEETERGSRSQGGSFRSNSNKVKNANNFTQSLYNQRPHANEKPGGMRSKPSFRSESIKIKNASLMSKGLAKQEQQVEEEKQRSKANFKTTAMVTKALAGKPRPVVPSTGPKSSFKTHSQKIRNVNTLANSFSNGREVSQPHKDYGETSYVEEGPRSSFRSNSNKIKIANTFSNGRVFSQPQQGYEETYYNMEGPRSSIRSNSNKIKIASLFSQGLQNRSPNMEEENQWQRGGSFKTKSQQLQQLSRATKGFSKEPPPPPKKKFKFKFNSNSIQKMKELAESMADGKWQNEVKGPKAIFKTNSERVKQLSGVAKFMSSDRWQGMDDDKTSLALDPLESYLEDSGYTSAISTQPNSSRLHHYDEYQLQPQVFQCKHPGVHTCSLCR